MPPSPFLPVAQPGFVRISLLIAENEMPASLTQWPWLALALFTLPLVLVAWKLRAFPTWWWTALIGFSLALSLFAFLTPDVLPLIFLFDFNK